MHVFSVNRWCIAAALAGFASTTAAAQTPPPGEIPAPAAEPAQAPLRTAGSPLPYAPQPQAIDQDGEPTPPASLLSLAPLPALPDQDEDEETLPALDARLKEPLFDSAVAMPLTPATVETAPLSASDIAGIGTLTQADGGFAFDVWAGSAETDIVAAFAQVQGRAPSPIVQTTLRRLALTIADSPSPTPQAAWAFLSARIGLLERVGDLDGLIALLALVPDDVAPLDVLAKKADIALLANDWASLCAASRVGLAQDTSAFWTGRRLLCHAMKGNRGAVDLLQDTTNRRDMPDTAVLAATQALLEAQPDGYSAALAQAKASLMSGTETPLQQAALALSADAGLSARWPAIVALGAAAQLTPSDFLNYIIATPSGTPQEAGLAPRQLQLALSGGTPATLVADALAVSFEARQSGLPHFWAGATAQALSAVSPNPELWLDAGTVAAHLAYGGFPERTAVWYDEIRTRSDPSDLNAARSLISVWPYALVSNQPGRIPFTPRIAGLWLDARDGQDDRQAQLTFAVFDALGYTVPPELWAAAGQAGPLPIPALPELEAYAGAGQTGMTVLTAIAALGPQGTQTKDVGLVKVVLTALRQAGLEDLARQMGAEVLFFAGVSIDAS